MARARVSLAAGTLLVLCPCAFALDPALDVSQYSHFSWKYRDGFTKGQINDIVQTPDGYLWLATMFGLFRFDGVTTVPWQPPQGGHLPSNIISRLAAGRDGTLWIGTRSGLASWRNGKLAEYPDLAGIQILGLREDHAGSIWAGGLGLPDGKLCEIQQGSVRCPELGGAGHWVAGIHQDSKGNLWIGLEKNVWRLKPGPSEFYPVTALPNGVEEMLDGENGDLLIGATGGLRRLVGGKGEMVYALPAAMREFTARRLLRDGDGGLWIGTNGRGIVHIYRGRTDVFSQVDGLSGDSIYRLFEDREGSIWAVTDKGLDRFRDLPVVTYSANEGVSVPFGTLLTAKDGGIWFGTQDGLKRLSDGGIAVYGEPGARGRAGVREIAVRGLPNQGFESFFQDSHAVIWLGMLTGVGYLQNDRFVSTAIFGRNIDAFAEDAAGNLWVADQELGLFQLSPSNEVHRTPWAEFGRRDPARRLVRDPAQGGIWLGFYEGGIAYFHDGQVRAAYSSSDGLAGSHVHHLRFDREGALWVSAEGGLSRLKDGRLLTLTSKNGLPCDAVHWTMEDDVQSVWLSMPCGLARVARSELDAWASSAGTGRRIIHSTLFDSGEGVRNIAEPGGFSPRVGKSPDGKLWFITSEGISVVDPRHIAFNKLPPPVHIEQLTADRKTYNTDFNLNPRLPPLVRDLEIDYTALSFVAPEKIQFKYKLEGHDRDWQEVGNRRQAFYTDLPPRRYRFRVAAANNSGVWNEAGAFFDFSIAPAYYQMTWFQAACAIAFVTLLWGLYRYRLYQVAREFSMRLDERVAERTRLARDLHDTLLQSFQGLMLRFQVVDDLLPQGKAKEQLEQTLQRADQAIAEGRSVVYDLRSSVTTTNDLAQAVKALGDELATQDSAAFSLVVEGPVRDLHPLIRDELYRITREAIRNAFSHARARRIETELTYGERAFRLRIRDDGEGIPPEILEEGRPGHYGLPGMRERAKQIGGRLDIWSGAGAGTEIELSMAGSIAYGTSTGRHLFRRFGKKAG